MDAEALERCLDAVQHLRHGIAGGARELLYVLPLVAVLRDRFALAHGLDGGAKAVHLRAGVVVVVLARDLVAREREQARDRVAVGAVPRGRDGERSRRVRRHHLDLDSLRRGGRCAAEFAADRRERIREPLVGEEEVDEAWAGDLRAFDVRKLGRLLGELRRHLARRLALRPGV